MALKVKKDRVLPYPVTARMLDDEKGKPVDVGFTIHYKPLSRAEYREKMREMNQAGDEEISMREALREMYDETRLAEYDAWLFRHIAGWGEDVIDEAEQPIPFTAENYELLMNIIPVARAIDDGLYACSREEPAKN